MTTFLFKLPTLQPMGMFLSLGILLLSLPFSHPAFAMNTPSTTLASSAPSEKKQEDLSPSVDQFITLALSHMPPGIKNRSMASRLTSSTTAIPQLKSLLKDKSISYSDMIYVKFLLVTYCMLDPDSPFFSLSEIQTYRNYLYEIKQRAEPDSVVYLGSLYLLACLEIGSYYTSSPTYYQKAYDHLKIVCEHERTFALSPFLYREAMMERIGLIFTKSSKTSDKEIQKALKQERLRLMTELEPHRSELSVIQKYTLTTYKISDFLSRPPPQPNSNLYQNYLKTADHYRDYLESILKRFKKQSRPAEWLTLQLAAQMRDQGIGGEQDPLLALETYLLVSNEPSVPPVIREKARARTAELQKKLNETEEKTLLESDASDPEEVIESSESELKREDTLLSLPDRQPQPLIESEMETKEEENSAYTQARKYEKDGNLEKAYPLFQEALNAPTSSSKRLLNSHLGILNAYLHGFAAASEARNSHAFIRNKESADSIRKKALNLFTNLLQDSERRHLAFRFAEDLLEAYRIFTPGAVELDLNGYVISQTTLASVHASFPQVTHLNLSNTQFTDDTLSYIPLLPSLQSVTLSETPTTDWGLQQVIQHPTLLNLDIARTLVTPEGLRFAHATQLNPSLSVGFFAEFSKWLSVLSPSVP